MRQKIDKETSEKYTPQVNIANQTNTKSLQHKKIIFKDAVVLRTTLCSVSYYTALIQIASQMALIVQVNEVLVTII